MHKTEKKDYMKNKREIIETAYKKGYKYEQGSTCCSQCTVAALQDSIEFVSKDEDIFRAASGLCGGMGPSEDGNCGAFIGSGMILSLRRCRRMPRVYTGMNATEYNLKESRSDNLISRSLAFRRGYSLCFLRKKLDSANISKTQMFERRLKL